jgi:DNA-directed RNA polymerase subunit RPC12/RpoP
MEHPFQINIPIYHEFYSFTCIDCGETFDDDYDDLNDAVCPICDSDLMVYHCDLCGVAFDHICEMPDCDQFELKEAERFKTITYKYDEMYVSRMQLHQELFEYWGMLVNEDMPKEIAQIIGLFLY